MDSTRIEPGPGQESVWDYPRPPRIERTGKRIEVALNGVVIAATSRAWRVLETSHPPVYYIPPDDLKQDCLVEAQRTSFCEWKGSARYVDLRVGDRVARAAGWYYPAPSPGFEPIRNHVSFYAGRVDRCTVDGEVVRPQPGSFYGGWITADVVGPFKGDRGTELW